MYMGETMTVPGGVYSDLVNYWYDRPYMWPGLEADKDQLRNLAEVLLPMYMHAVTTGGQAMLVDDIRWNEANRPLRQYLQDRSGQPQGNVDSFLQALQQATLEGAIDGRYLSPAVWEEVAPPTMLEQIQQAGITGGIADVVGSSVNKLLITAGIVAAVVFIGRAAILKK